MSLAAVKNGVESLPKHKFVKGATLDNGNMQRVTHSTIKSNTSQLTAKQAERKTNGPVGWFNTDGSKNNDMGPKEADKSIYA